MILPTLKQQTSHYKGRAEIRRTPLISQQGTENAATIRSCNVILKMRLISRTETRHILAIQLDLSSH
jgi:hypothetical protein